MKENIKLEELGFVKFHNQLDGKLIGYTYDLGNDKEVYINSRKDVILCEGDLEQVIILFKYKHEKVVKLLEAFN